MSTTLPIGERLRDWRQRRRLSQLELALEAEISARHLSFLETGRANPSRDMVLRLAERLDVPLGERNSLLLAAGFAPSFPDPSLADPVLKPVLDGIKALLKAHEPFPAVAVDRKWDLVAANAPIARLIESAGPPQGETVNVIRLSLHPQGLAPRIRNYHEWRGHLLHRLRRQFADTADADLGVLIDEVAAYPSPPGATAQRTRIHDAIAIPLVLDSPTGPMSFVSTTMSFGAPSHPALAELAIETFLPADAATAEALRIG
ncbi:MAG TPA: helix-turn-helix domain-containing protein [Devosia sp.]|nr:helix-turn-helix domain-containing protein [Devosia sp.]